MGKYSPISDTFDYHYPAILERGYDGDTFWCETDRGDGLERLMEVRLSGVDTPELKPRHEGRTDTGLAAERQAAAQAAEFTTTWLAKGPFIVHSDELENGGEYGRALGRVERDGEWLADLLLTNDLAVADPDGTVHWHIVKGVI